MRVVVTGADGALGKAVAERLSKDWTVIPADVDEVDLRDFEATKKWADKVGGPVHGLVALAGGFSMAEISAIDGRTFEQQFQLNAGTAFSTLSAFASKLADGAAVVLVGSQAHKGAAGMSAYAASKSSVVSLAMSASLEWKARGIRVNTILPDIIDTPSNRKSMPDANFEKWQKPSEIAEVIAFLLSERAVNVSGNAIELGRV